MKKPKNKLPWLSVKSDLALDSYSYQIEQASEENLVIADIPSSISGDKEDSDYIVQACNNFPEAIRLLKMLVAPMSATNVLPIREWLKSLEE